MMPYLIFALFATQLLGLDASLAPGLSVKNLFLYLIFAALAIETVVKRQRELEVLSVILPFVLYVIYAMFSLLIVVLFLDYQDYSLLKSLMALKAGPVEELLILLVFFYGISDQQQALWLIRRMLWLVLVAYIFVVVDTLDAPDLGFFALDNGRLDGLTGNAIMEGMLLVLFLPGVIAIQQTSSGARKWLAGIGVCVLGFALVLTVSRGAILASVCAGVFGAFYLSKNLAPGVILRGGLIAALASVVMFFGAIAVGFLDIILERFGDMVSSSSFDATSGRNVIWGRAFGRMIDYPITLITGFGWFAYASSSYFAYGTHNQYLMIFYNLGAIGLGLFLVVVVNVLRIVRAALNQAGDAARPFLIAFVFGFAALLVALIFADMYRWLFIWAYVGVLLRLAVSQTGHEPAIAIGRAGPGRITEAAQGIRPRSR